MQTKTNNMIRSMKDLRVSQRSLAVESGVKRQIINAVIKEKRGLSLKSSRRIAPQLGINPVSLYLETQLGAIKARLESTPVTKANKHVPSSVLRSIAQVVKALDDVPRSEIASDGDAQAALEELREIASALIAHGTTAEKRAADEGEDCLALTQRGFYARAPKGPKTEAKRRDMHGKRPK